MPQNTELAQTTPNNSQDTARVDLDLGSWVKVDYVDLYFTADSPTFIMPQPEAIASAIQTFMASNSNMSLLPVISENLSAILQDEVMFDERLQEIVHATEKRSQTPRLTDNILTPAQATQELAPFAATRSVMFSHQTTHSVEDGELDAEADPELVRIDAETQNLEQAADQLITRSLVVVSPCLSTSPNLIFTTPQAAILLVLNHISTQIALSQEYLTQPAEFLEDFALINKIIEKHAQDVATVASKSAFKSIMSQLSLYIPSVRDEYIQNLMRKKEEHDANRTRRRPSSNTGSQTPAFDASRAKQTTATALSADSPAANTKSKCVIC